MNTGRYDPDSRSAEPVVPPLAALRDQLNVFHDQVAAALHPIPLLVANATNADAAPNHVDEVVAAYMQGLQAVVADYEHRLIVFAADPSRVDVSTLMTGDAAVYFSAQLIASKIRGVVTRLSPGSATAAKAIERAGSSRSAHEAAEAHWRALEALRGRVLEHRHWVNERRLLATYERDPHERPKAEQALEEIKELLAAIRGGQDRLRARNTR